MVDWRPVLGFEGLYEVSDEGAVRSVDRVIHRKDGHAQTARGRVLSQGVHWRTGYRSVNLWKENRGCTRAVHRVVLESFIGPRPAELEARHADGNPANNRLTNLSWDTRVENMRDQLRHGTQHNANKTHCKQGHEYTPENTRYRPRGGRNCRKCQRAAIVAFKARRRVEKVA